MFKFLTTNIKVHGHYKIEKLRNLKNSYESKKESACFCLGDT